MKNKKGKTLAQVFKEISERKNNETNNINEKRPNRDNIRDKKIIEYL